MLTHFEDLYLFPLLEHLDLLHVGLLHCLYRNLLSSLLVHGKFDHTELTLAKDFIKLVEVKEIREATRNQKDPEPFFGSRNVSKVEDARFVWRQDYFDRVEINSCVWAFLLTDLLDEGAGKTVHHTMLLVSLVSIAIDVIAH